MCASSNWRSYSRFVPEDFPVLDGLTMWSLAFNRLWQSSSLSFLLGRTLDRTSATKTSVKND